MDLRKYPDPILISADLPMFSWTIFEQATSYSSFTHFSTFWSYGAQFSERDCNLRPYLHINDSQSSGMQGTFYKRNEQ